MRICGSITKELDDGTEVHADWMFDSESGEIVQIGGEGELTEDDMEIVHMMLATAQDMDAAEIEAAEVEVGDPEVEQ